MPILLELLDKNIMLLLSKPTQDALNSNFWLVKSKYFNSNFMPLLRVLTDKPSGGKSGGKVAMKEKFIKIFDLLEEAAECHWILRVLEDDKEWRKTIVVEVVWLVVLSLHYSSLQLRIRRRSSVRVGTCICHHFCHSMYCFIEIDEPGSPLCSYATHFHFSDIAYQAWLHHCDCHMMQPTMWTTRPSTMWSPPLAHGTTIGTWSFWS